MSLDTSLKARARSTPIHPLDHAHIALGPFRWDTSPRRPRGIRFSPGRLAITSRADLAHVSAALTPQSLLRNLFTRTYIAQL